MRPYYDGVKFFDVHDLSLSINLKKAENIIIDFPNDEKISDVNRALELYNTHELLNSGVPLTEWSEEVYNGYKNKSKLILQEIAIFFAKIDDKNFLRFCDELSQLYFSDFWALFEKYKSYKKVSGKIMYKYLLLPDTDISELLRYKGIVNQYDEELANVLRQSNQTVRILSRKFLEKNTERLFLPQSFKKQEYEAILQRYVNSEQVSSNILHLIIVAPKNNECPISDKLRLSAKHAYNKLWENHANKTSANIKINFSDIDSEDVYVLKQSDSCYEITYNLKWLNETLDYPSILNNFIYVFEFVDLHARSTFVSVKSKIGILENMLMVKGRTTYLAGYQFHVNENFTSGQMNLYYEFLKEHNISIESIFMWFFNEYIPEEFGIDGFKMQYSSSELLVEKCRNLTSEMDGVLKQFKMFVCDGKIDRELFELASEHLFFDSLPSFIPNKYAYPTEALENEMQLFFSDQTSLAYIQKTKSKYLTLFDLLRHEDVNISDFREHQIKWINVLIKKGSLILENDGRIKFNNVRVAILKDFYDHEVCCTSYWGKDISAFFEMEKAGEITFKSSLFSKPEVEYLNYILNKSQFSDGLDLRNKYAHSTYSQDENIQRTDYIMSLKIMILIIIKINEEFCLRGRQGEVQNS